jgi:hypothetical protein
MSHFTVLVIGDKVEEQLAPYQENNMGDCPGEYLEFNDITEEERNNYENKTTSEFYCSSRSSWGLEVSEQVWELLHNLYQFNGGFTVDLNTFKDQGILPVTITVNKRYRCYKTGAKEYPEKHIWIEVLQKMDSENKCKIKVINPPKEIPLKEEYKTFEEYMDDYCGREPNEEGRYGYWENPNAKWDWWKVGGRWNGFFKLKKKLKLVDPDGISNDLGFSKGEIENFLNMAKNDRDKFLKIIDKYGSKSMEIKETIFRLLEENYADGDLGSPGVFGNDKSKDYEGRADSALKRDIDLEFMENEAAEKSKDRYETIEKFYGKIPKVEKLWKDLFEQYEKGEITYQEARKGYHSQKAVKLKESLTEGLIEDKFSKETISFIRWHDLEDYQLSKDEYVERARKNCLTTFAVLKDGKWYEKGELGWWGCVSNEKDEEEWANQFYHLINTIPEDTLLTVVDCHI